MVGLYWGSTEDLADVSSRGIAGGVGSLACPNRQRCHVRRTLTSTSRLNLFDLWFGEPTQGQLCLGILLSVPTSFEG
jgi:hypothetical protein